MSGDCIPSKVGLLHQSCHTRDTWQVLHGTHTSWVKHEVRPCAKPRLRVGYIIPKVFDRYSRGPLLIFPSTGLHIQVRPVQNPLDCNAYLSCANYLYPSALHTIRCLQQVRQQFCKRR